MQDARSEDIRRFRRAVRAHYREHGRHDLPWRHTEDPYGILVSEVMLQQTQAERVRGYFPAFLARFPEPRALAGAPVADVLAAWQGLGYNRRALALQKAAVVIVERHGGTVPQGREDLLALPGVGPYTAGAVRAFAWNLPGILVETNVRTAHIHHFFPDAERVGERELAELIGASLPPRDPRAWYWALMDYGAHLKRTVGNANRASASYARQERFEGSDRQLRGRVLRVLLEGPADEAGLRERLGGDPRLARVLAALTGEGFVRYHDGRHEIPR